MKVISMLSVLLMSTISQADIIKCSFTEPFYNLEYSMTASTLTKNSADTGKSVIKGVSFQILGGNKFVLLNSKKKVIVTLTLDNAGSDGMSDTIYPYTAQVAGEGKFANGGFGRCSSNFLPAVRGNN